MRLTSLIITCLGFSGVLFSIMCIIEESIFSGSHLHSALLMLSPLIFVSGLYLNLNTK